MTAQIAERLHYQGEDVAMCTNPLSDYFAMGGVNPRFESNCTALWRGYVGSWEIVNDRLYLFHKLNLLRLPSSPFPAVDAVRRDSSPLHHNNPSTSYLPSVP